MDPGNFNDFKEEVIRRNDIVGVISESVNIKRKGSVYSGLCPFHNEKTPSFVVSPTKQIYHCFGCNVGGNVISFVMEYENVSFKEALKILAQRAGMEMPEYDRSKEDKGRQQKKALLYEIYKKAATYYYRQLYSEKGVKGLEYFKSRGLDDATIRRFGLGYSDSFGKGLYNYLKEEGYKDDILKESGIFTFDEKNKVYDKFWNRVIFPIMDINNRVIGFGGRVMSDALPKYLNSPETILFDKSRNLFGMNYARRSRVKKFILCEGYMDVIALHRSGFDYAVASLGTALTESQAQLLKRYADNVYLCYDSDEAGTKAAMRAIPILRAAGLVPRIINMKPHKDPDEFIKNLGAEEFQKRIDKAQGSFMFEVETLEKSFDLKDPDERTRFFTEVAEKICAFELTYERRKCTQAVAAKYDITESELNEILRGKLDSAKVREPVGTPDNRQMKREDNNRGKPADRDAGINRSRALLLGWMADDREVFLKAEKVVAPDDFGDDFYQRLAAAIFTRYEKQGKVEPASVINEFELSEEQGKAAEVLGADLKAGLTGEDQFMDVGTGTDDKDMKLIQLVKRVKRYSLEQNLKTCNDPVMLQQLILDMKSLDRLNSQL